MNGGWCISILEKPSQVPVALTAKYLEGRLCSGISGNGEYISTAIRSIHICLNSYYLQSEILSNHEMLGSETLTSGTAMPIELLADDWPLHIHRCPLSDWSGLTLLSKLCIHCYKDSFHFDDERLCMGVYCLTDRMFSSRGEAGIFFRCRCCYAVIGSEGYLSCGDPACVLYFLRIYRITTAYGSVFRWAVSN